MTKSTWMWVALLAVLAACKKDAPAAEKHDRYTVKGTVKSVTAAANRVVIAHEEIPSFKDREGQAVGMMAMSMPFAVEKSVDLSNLAPGTRVEFTFETRWKDANPVHIVELKPLAAEERDGGP